MSKQDRLIIPIGSKIVDGSTIYRLIGGTADVLLLRPEGANAEDRLDTLMPMSEFLDKQKRPDFEVQFSTAATMREIAAVDPNERQYVELPEKEQNLVLFKLAVCLALEELRREEVLELTETSISANHDALARRSDKLYRKISGQSKKGNKRRVLYDLSQARTVIDDYREFMASGCNPAVLRTKHDRAGRPAKQYSPWVLDLMEEAVQQCLDGREPHKVRAWEKLEIKLAEGNASRAAENPAHKPETVSRTAFYDSFKDYRSVAIDVGRKGRDEIKRILSHGVGETPARMLGEEIHVDESEIPLWVFLELTGLHRVVGSRTMARLKKEAQSGKTGKIWILVAFDVATKMPLAFSLAENPSAGQTVVLLRRLVSDKTKLAKEAGCECAPPPPVRPHLIVMDTGSGLWNNVVPRAILALGGAFRFGRTKSPSDKAFVERFFATLGADVIKALHGYNGQGPGLLPGYDGQEMASMSVAQLERILWWWFTDCYPKKRSQAKGLWGGVREEVFKKIVKRYGHLPPLSSRDIRRAIGLRVTRKVTKMGIEAYRMPYQGSRAFQKWVQAHQDETVTVCIDPDSIAEVTALTEDGEVFHLKASLSEFRDFSLAEWVHFLEEWRSVDPYTETVNQAVLARFYRRLRAETERLLEFHGKEHKVPSLEQAQAWADSLCVDLNIVVEHSGSPAADLSAVFQTAATGPGIYRPGDEVVEVEPNDSEGEAVAAASSEIDDKPAPTPGRTFSGPPKGEGSLE